MNAYHARPRPLPVSETTFRATRAESTLEVQFTAWPDHESATVTVRSNGKTVFVAIQPREVRAVADALLKMADAKGWK